mmetsp:Transcript_7328/g.15192  ORF Transcript_7328/g.15192 Transcript_7328/m.15192 type:complete len:80 (+) Transcript_7328:83-322(+)
MALAMSCGGPADPGNASSMVATAMSIFRQSTEGIGSGGAGIPPADGRRGAFGEDAPPPLHDEEHGGDGGLQEPEARRGL